jgi:hypothetical protein
VDPSQIACLRAQGRSWSEIVAEPGIGKGTAQRALAGLAQNCLAERTHVCRFLAPDRRVRHTRLNKSQLALRAETKNHALTSTMTDL